MTPVPVLGVRVQEVEDVEALRLLAEVRAAQRRFGDSAQEYRRALRVGEGGWGMG